MADNVNRLLIVDEEREVTDLVAAVARSVGYTVASAPSGAGFVQLLASFRPSLIMMELHLPDTDGVELLRSLAARACSANVVLMSTVDERVLGAAHEVGVSHGLAMCGTLAKPLPAAELKTKLGAMLHQSPELDNEDLQRGIENGEFVPYYQPKVSLVQNGWVIDGVKHFCTMALGASHYMVWCALDGEADMGKALLQVVVPADTPGITTDGKWDTLGMRGTYSPAVTFTKVRVPRDAALGRPGSALQIGVIEGFALGYAAVYIGLAEAAFDFAVDYARKRIVKPEKARPRAIQKADQPRASLTWMTCALR